MKTNRKIEEKFSRFAIITVVVIVVIALISYIIAFVFPEFSLNKKTNQFIIDENMSRNQIKETIIESIKNSKERKLSSEEKLLILKELGGEKTSQYQLTAEEKNLILNAINK